MQSKYRFIIICLFNFLSIYVNGQNNTTNKVDTIFVYETEIVYDTIFVFDTIHAEKNRDIIPIDFIEPKQFELSILQLDTTNKNANLLIISENYSATIPLNSIILNENVKKLESMKKLSFLGVMIFATQSMLFAQSDFGISVGGGVWWAECNNPSVSTKSYIPNSSINLYFKQALKNKFFIETKLGYNLLFSNSSYKVHCPNPSEHDASNNHSCLNIAFPYDPTHLPVDDSDRPYINIGDEASCTNFHLIEIPLNIGYTIKNFNPYIGIMYSLKMYNSSKTEVIYDENQDVTGFVNYESEGLNTFQNNLGLTAGIDYTISKKWSVGINYYHGLTKDYNYNVFIYDFQNVNIISTDNYNWKRRSVEIRLSYSFRKKDKKQTESEEVETYNY